MRAFSLLLFLVCAALQAVPAAGQVAKLLPFDEAPQDPSFFLFRARLLEALAARDTTFLYAHLAPEAHLSFGGHTGRAGLQELWHPGEAESELWSTLARVAAGGGAFQPTHQGGTRFVAPYYWAAWDTLGLDAFSHGVVLGAHVRVREAPGLESAVLDTLSHDVVRVADFYPVGDEAEGWARVTLADGRTGYLSQAYLASPIGYRVGFEQRDGVWQITYFVAGD